MGVVLRHAWSESQWTVLMGYPTVSTNVIRHKIVSVLQRLHGETGRSISVVQKHDGQTDKQTDRQTDKKTQRFWPPRRRMKSEPIQTWHGDRGPRARSYTSKTFEGLMHRFATRGR